VTAKVTKLVGLSPSLFLSLTNLVVFAAQKITIEIPTKKSYDTKKCITKKYQHGELNRRYK
jgi:hypothetical protein